MLLGTKLTDYTRTISKKNPDYVTSSFADLRKNKGKTELQALKMKVPTKKGKYFLSSHASIIKISSACGSL